MTLYYNHFSWFASIPFDCPLCSVHIPAGVKHECSNPDPAQTAKPVGDLEISVRAYNALRSANINTIGELQQFTSKQLLRFPNLGKKCVSEITAALQSIGMNLADDYKRPL